MRDGGSLPLYKLGLCFLFVLWAVVLVSSPAWAQDLEPTACEGCTASVMNQIAAAFATQGYWVQADLIYQLGSTDLGLWTPLLYIMAVFSGLIMMAMGQPPRIYMWFLLGPAIYNWLLFTPTERAGVSWIVANHVQDQKEVWKLAEVGLINSNEIIRQGLTPDADNGPESRASIAMPFAWYDDLISAQIQFLVGWSGIYRREDSKGGSTNISAESAGGGALRGGKNAAWHILTNSKWPILDNITASSVHNQDLRESFVTF
ncbi:MAG: hypothetical protein GX589_09555, partial [Deltaproteobacteria bacterium]|nr:hypothetical protein [Deltaproteobacteria bacterium]